MRPPGDPPPPLSGQGPFPGGFVGQLCNAVSGLFLYSLLVLLLATARLFWKPDWYSYASFTPIYPSRPNSSSTLTFSSSSSSSSGPPSGPPCFTGPPAGAPVAPPGPYAPQGPSGPPPAVPPGPPPP